MIGAGAGLEPMYSWRRSKYALFIGACAAVFAAVSATDRQLYQSLTHGLSYGIVAIPTVQAYHSVLQPLVSTTKVTTCSGWTQLFHS